jgi:tetratricopeptide (TPR) repeat protein
MMRGLSLLVLVSSIAAGPVECQAIPLLSRDIKDLEALVRSDSNDAPLNYYLGLAYWRRGKWAQADSLLRLSIRLEPRFAEGYLALYFLPFARRSQLFNEQLKGRVPDAWRPAVAEAQRFYQRAFRTDPLVSLRVMGVAFNIREPTIHDYTSPAAREYEMYYAWFVDLGLGRYRSAYDRLRGLAEREFEESKHPERVPDFILWYRGLAAAHSSLYGPAIDDFRALLKRALHKLQRDEIVHVPVEDNEYRFMLAALHHSAGHADSALALYQESLEHDLGLVMAHTYMAGLYESAGFEDEALLERRRAAEVSSDEPNALFEFAASLFNTGKVAEAEEPLRSAIALNSRYSPPYYLLGRALEELGRPAEARETYQLFMSRSPQRLRDLRLDTEQRLANLPR